MGQEEIQIYVFKEYNKLFTKKYQATEMFDEEAWEGAKPRKNIIGTDMLEEELM